jgi:lysophospholipase L1-like esterase
VFVLGQAAAAARLPPLPESARILAFGDSLTGGVGGVGESYPSDLARLIRREVINAGLPGQTTADGRRRLLLVLQEERPDLLILCMGINDFLQGVPRGKVRANLLAMLEMAREANVPVLLLAIPARGEALADPLFAEVAVQGGAVIDERAMIETLVRADLKADLVHPNREGYRRIAESIAAKLRAAGMLTR